MALALVTASDFASGELKLALNQYSTTYLENDVLSEINQKYWLYRCLGKTLGDLFIADLNEAETAPETEKWLNIFNAFIFTDNYGYQIKCDGIKEIMKMFAWQVFVMNQRVSNTQDGNMIGIKEAEIFDTFKYAVINNRNSDQMSSLYCYMILNPTDYPDPKTSFIELDSAF